MRGYRPEVAAGLGQAWAALLAAVAWHPFTFYPAMAGERLAAMSWLPLREKVGGHYLWSLEDLIGQGVRFAVLGAVVTWGLGGRGKRARVWPAAAVCGAVAAGLELGQATVPGRTAQPDRRAGGGGRRVRGGGAGAAGGGRWGQRGVYRYGEAGASAPRSPGQPTTRGLTPPARHDGARMDKHTLFMLAVTGAGALGSLAFGPYVGIVVYFVYAVLRPQYLWQYAMPKEFQWSLYAAVAAIAASLLYRFRLIGYVTAGPTRGASVPPWNAVHWLMLLFTFWMTLSYLKAENQDRAWLTYDIYLKTTLMFVVASLCVYRLSQFWVLLAALALSAGYVGYEANYAYFAWRRNDIHTSGFGGLDNNGAGLMLGMAIPLCYFLWEGTAGKFRWVYLLIIPVLAHAVQLTFSRGAMLSAVVVSPVVFALSRYKRWLAAFAVAGVGFVLFTSGKELRERFFSINAHEVDESANMRKRAWKAAFEIASDKPFFGVGLRCSAPHMKGHGATENMAIHSQYLQLAADTGWAGMGCYCAVYLTAVVYGFRLCWRLRKWPDYPEVRQARALAAALTTALLLYGVGAVFLSLETFELPYVLFLLTAQLWNCYRGGGIQAAALQNGSALPPPPAPLLAPRRRPLAAAVPPPRAPRPAPVIDLTPAGPA